MATINPLECDNLDCFIGRDVDYQRFSPVPAIPLPDFDSLFSMLTMMVLLLIYRQWKSLSGLAPLRSHLSLPWWAYRWIVIGSGILTFAIPLPMFALGIEPRGINSVLVLTPAVLSWGIRQLLWEHPGYWQTVSNVFRKEMEDFVHAVFAFGQFIVWMCRGAPVATLTGIALIGEAFVYGVPKLVIVLFKGTLRQRLLLLAAASIIIASA